MHAKRIMGYRLHSTLSMHQYNCIVYTDIDFRSAIMIGLAAADQWAALRI